MPAPPPPASVLDQLAAFARAGGSKQAAARKFGLAVNTVRRYWPDDVPALGKNGLPVVPPTAPRLPEPAPEAGGPALPEPCVVPHEPYQVDGSGRWLVLSDLHIPYHDPATVRRAVAEAKRQDVTGVLLNGDVLDFYQVSKYSRDPSKPRVKAEVEKGREFFAWVRAEFPRARLIFKYGNHDERLALYLADRAPELFDLDDLQLDRLLRLADVGVEWVGDKRAVHLGRLPVFHGHEFRGGQGVNPARWLFLQITSTGACGHFHRTSEHHEAGYDGRLHGVWSFGCACYLRPLYAPNNKWNHGHGLVELHGGADGGFTVTSRRILRDGRVV